MDLIAHKSKASVPSLLLLLLLLALTMTPAVVAQQAFPNPCSNQSPRHLDFDQTRQSAPTQGKDYNFTSQIPLVTVTHEGPFKERVEYQRRVLSLCDRHYHYPIETPQGCSSDTTKDLGSGGSGPLPPDARVEIHRVYADAVSGPCSPENGYDFDLACCAKPPFVVIASSAQIVDDSSKSKLPSLPKFAEWSGSATSETATFCNSTPAMWHFEIGCGVQYTREELEKFVSNKGPHKAREMQGDDLLSSDLTFVSQDTKTACRMVRTTPIGNGALAQRICPGVCKWPLNKFTGTWTNIYANRKATHAICQCCPLPRPQ